MILLIQTLLLTSYLALVGYKFKRIPSSISETYYLWGDNHKIFTLWMLGMGVVTCLYPSPWLFFAGALLCITAVSAQYRDRTTNTIHYIGAVGAYVMACIEINPLLTGCIVLLSFLL